MRLIRWMFAAVVFAGLALGCSREEPQQQAPAFDLVTVEPSPVAFGDEFTVRTTLEKREGVGVGIFNAEAGAGAGAITSQPLDGADNPAAKFGTTRLKPGRYIAAITDAAGQQLAKVEFQVAKPATKPSVHVAMTGIYPGDPIKVMWNIGSSDASGWIGIYKMGEPNLAAHLARVDTNASSRGKIEIGTEALAKPLTPGKYEVRLMRGESYVELANAPFVVANPDAKPEVSVDPSRIRLGEPIVVSFKDAPGNQGDWIGLYKAGDSDTHHYLTYLYTGNGAIAGQVTFDGRKYRNELPPGEYQAKLLLDNGYKELASAQFWITSSDGIPLVTLARPRIKVGEAVVVRWVEAPERAWIGIYKADDPEHVVVGYAGAATDGTVTFNADDFRVVLAPGDYKVRLMREDRSTELASAQFRVLDPNAGPKVTLTKTELKSGEPFQVSWKDSPGNSRDWIGIYKAGDASTHRYIAWLYTEGAIDGEVTFDKPLPPGQYVAKLLVDNGYEEVGVSEPFTVRAQ
ncbi:MAG TPA: hypothetical protein VJV39_10275 [Dongiaceae bacterium]|nr:hypothetical protein [Dongiaceae bacterium]